MIPEVDTTYLAIMLAIAFAFAYRQQVLSLRLREQLHGLQYDRADERTGLLSQMAIGLRLEPELAWAELEGIQMSLVQFRVYGNHPERAARAMRSIMRGHENGFLLGPERFLVGLWSVDADGTRLAIGRLASRMVEAGARTVDAGFAIFPDDATDVDEMIEICSQSMRPFEEYADDAVPLPERRLRGLAARFAGVLAAAGPGLVLALGLLMVTYATYPYLLSQDVPTGATLVQVLVVAGALAAAVGAAGAFVWNRGAPGLPAGRSTSRVGLRGGVAVGCVTFALLTWGVVAPGMPRVLPSFAGPLAVFLALVLLALAQGRFLVRADQPALFAGFLASGVALHFIYDAAPFGANVLRVVAAVFLGALIARNIERISFAFVIALAIAITDIWSVYSEKGTTNQIVNSDEGWVQNLLQLLLLEAPKVGEYPLFYIGTADLIFLVVFISFVHYWRLGVPRTAIAMMAALIGSMVFSSLVEDGVPVLPFMAISFLVANFDALREDVSDLLRGDTADAPERAPTKAGVAT